MGYAGKHMHVHENAEESPRNTLDSRKNEIVIFDKTGVMN